MLKETKNLHPSDSLAVVLVYTSLCGTCEMAKRMLHIISESIKGVAFYQLNANFYPEDVNLYQITSVPCFMIFHQGELVDQFYAFHSVSFLYERINGMVEKYC